MSGGRTSRKIFPDSLLEYTERCKTVLKVVGGSSIMNIISVRTGESGKWANADIEMSGGVQVKMPGSAECDPRVDDTTKPKSSESKKPTCKPSQDLESFISRLDDRKQVISVSHFCVLRFRVVLKVFTSRMCSGQIFHCSVRGLTRRRTCADF